MLKRLESIITLFTRITTCVLFITAVYIHIFWEDENKLGVENLLQILIVSGICALGSLILPFSEMEYNQISKCKLLVHEVAYYLFVNATVLICAYQFHWCTLGNWKQLLGMVVAIALVYAAVTIVSYWIEYQTAEKMNSKLKERERSKELGN